MWLLMFWPVMVGLIWRWQVMLGALAVSAVIGWSLRPWPPEPFGRSALAKKMPRRSGAVAYEVAR
jgi:hypothetical protein